ncbi:hypothetical protein [Spirosoma foliorum]|uniref:Uncharacterized protein n=1 Tax=Spirosoma foliorum TaxID=2710596 RepID=A0A7G5GS67_9BACT|nr:hypothetical protein [Spirosoma foliorum]QMW01709.1 hypothetical protein H3H32_27730 [Spirosoma foliorum]
MENLFEISGDDIAKLSDSNLRDLIGLLCEADCKAHELSPRGVTWGGHQDAKDGGLDVVVELENIISGGFIPRLKNGFQVKKPDMSASAIVEEMKPNGILRDSIKSLIQAGGSYIIVCSTGSTSYKALQDRRHAMQKAVIGAINHEKIHLDFYDRGRVATWVRTHPSMVLWVRNKVGRNLKGWQPYENWTQPGEVIGEYLFDEGIRLFDDTKKIKEKEVDIEAGLNKIRAILATQGSCVRLAGLSGVGKTRFVQALFDERIGEAPLNSSQVFYTDMSNGPDPDPRTFVEQLITQRTKAIVVCDNCPPELHRKLTEVCSGSGSTLSLITVEYDVRDDSAEETHIFRLKPSSDELIYKLIRKRFGHISEVAAKSIASFSGGNARIAIALANTVRQGETLSGFKNEELFDRLFRQRNETNADLKKAAEVMSLVYSFEGTETHAISELSILASLINKPVHALYGDVAELRNRDLIQSRSVWRALLPQAIANRLAKNALKTIPLNSIVSTFLENGSERLIKSFTRRLNYLHDSDEAVQIVNGWLEEDGWLDNLENLNDFGINVLENIAPVSPKNTLEAIERAVKNVESNNGSIAHHSRIVQLLRKVAYDSELFIKSVRVLYLLTLSGRDDERKNAKAALKSLFFLYLSGTHAPIEIRYSFINELITSTDSNKQELGLLLLETSLEAWHFNSMYSFDFGARPRDYGYTPQTVQELSNWHGYLIKKCVDIILLDSNLSDKLKKILANKFRGLWTRSNVQQELQDAAVKIKNTGSWIEGWLEVRTAIYFDKEDNDDDGLRKLRNLSRLLEPVNLVEQIRAYALSSRGMYIDEDERKDIPSANWEKVDEISFNLAQLLAQDEISLDILIPELMYKESNRLWIIGRGLAKGSNDRNALWKKLRDQLEKTDESKRNATLLQGYLVGTYQNDIELSNIILDEILTDPILGCWFPDFQTNVIIDANGIERLHKALDFNIAPLIAYRNLWLRQIDQTLIDQASASLIMKILSKEGGDDIALDLFSSFLRSSDDKECPETLLEVGRAILVGYQYSEHVDRRLMDYNLSTVAKNCLLGESASESAVTICRNIVDAFASRDFYADECDDFLEVIAELQPKAFLDVIIGTDLLEDYQLRRLISDSFSRKRNPLTKLTDSLIISWCDIDPSKRYEKIATLIDVFFHSQDTSRLEWYPLIGTILKKAPSTESVIAALNDAIWPRSWSNSLADILQYRLILLEDFFLHKNIQISAWARETHSKMEAAIIEDREQAREKNRREDERFE